MPQSEQVTELLTSEAVGALVDLDQPIDFAVAVTGTGANMKDLTALSAAVKDPEKAKAALSERYKLVPGENGVIAIQGLGKPQREGGDDDRDDEKHGQGDSVRTCELAPAFGDAPVRLVCGLTAKAVAELGPWLTRTATRGPATGDLHVELRMKPLHSTIADQKRLLGAILGSVLGARLGLSSLRNLAEAFATDAVDFAGDLDGASADVTLGDAGIQLSTTMKLQSTTSMLARLATAHPERSGPAPAAFWQLPGDADFAVFSRGVDEAQLARPRDLILAVVSDALGESGVKDADRKAVVDGLGKLVSPAAHVYGSGLDVEAVRKAIATDRGADDSIGAVGEGRGEAAARRGVLRVARHRGRRAVGPTRGRAEGARGGDWVDPRWARRTARSSATPCRRRCARCRCRRAPGSPRGRSTTCSSSTRSSARPLRRRARAASRRLPTSRSGR